MIFYDKNPFGLGETHPLLQKKSKKSQFFSDKEILDQARPMPPPPFLDKLRKKNSFIFLMPPLRSQTQSQYANLIPKQFGLGTYVRPSSAPFQGISQGSNLLRITYLCQSLMAVENYLKVKCQVNQCNVHTLQTFSLLFVHQMA